MHEHCRKRRGYSECKYHYCQQCASVWVERSAPVAGKGWQEQQKSILLSARAIARHIANRFAEAIANAGTAQRSGKRLSDRDARPGYSWRRQYAGRGAKRFYGRYWF